ncbi:hypothetical protein JYT36_00950 [Bacteroidales bacterium AH-315-N07]|nr:hypothetical protein [Bacteroidales bacterium AH-315-N07]
MKIFNINLTKLGFILVIAIAFIACSKDKKVAGQLDGTWAIQKITIGTKVYTDSLATMILSECEDNSTCDGTWKDFTGKSHEMLWWEVENDGKEFYWSVLEADDHPQDIHPNNISGIYTIEEISDSKFIIKSCDSGCESKGTPLEKNVTIEMTK